MEWYNSVADGIKRRLCKYALQSFLGEYLLDDVSIDQLSLDIYNGTGTIQSLHFNVQAVNKALTKGGIPLQLVEGYIGSITVSVPWKSLINDDTSLEIHGIEATFQPCPVESSSSGEFDPTWLSQSTMSASMQMAEECLKDDKEVRSTPDGLKNATKTIESVISRVRLTLVNTTIRIENCPTGAENGQALEIHIGRLEFSDDSSDNEGSSVDPPMHSVKNVHISGGLSMYTDTFLPCHRGVSSQSQMSSTVSSDIFRSALSSHSPILRQPSYVASTAASAEGLPQERSYLNSKPIKFLSTIGELQTKIAIKNDDEVKGPKVKLEVQLNSLGIFLAPNQIHHITELLTIVTSSVSNTATPDGTLDLGAQPFHLPGKSHQFRADQYNQVENDMQFQLTSRLLLPGHLDLEQLRLGEIDSLSVDSGMFQSVKGQTFDADVMTTSMYSGYSGSVGTTTAPSTAFPFAGGSSAAGESRGRVNQSRPRQPKKLDETKSQEVVAKANLARVTLVLLNEDPLTTPDDAFQCGETAVEKLHKLSERFFDSYQSHIARGVTDLLDMRADVEESCTANHVKLLAKSIIADVKQCSHHKSKRNHSELTSALTITSCEVTEWVKAEDNIKKTYPVFNQQQTSEILKFTRNTDETPSVRISLSSTTFSIPQTRDTRTDTKVTVELGRECQAEVDISIADRLNGLLNPVPAADNSFSPNSTYMCDTSSPIREAAGSNKCVLNLRSESDVVVHLRFPIADLRTDPDQKYNWWSRKLRQEILELHISKPQCTLPLSSPGLDMEFTCRSARAFFVMGPDRVAIANIGQEYIDSSEGLERPRLVVKTYAVKINSLLEDDNHPDSFDSLNGACSELPATESTPFSTKKAMYSHNEELKIPGSKREVADFEHLTKSNTQLYIHLDLPAVNVVVPNQKVLEVMYNRICNDLLLWEPLAPVPGANNHTPQKLMASIMDHGLNDLSYLGASRYLPCKSTFIETGGSDDEFDDIGEEMLYSIHSSKGNSRQSYQRNSVPQQHGQNKACVFVGIKKGRLALVHPTLNADKSVMRDAHGMSVLDIQDGVIYVNSQSMGNPNLNFISIHSGQCMLYHDGCISGEYSHPEHIERLRSAPPNLPVVLSLCPNSVPNNQGDTVGCKGDEDMLGVAIRVSLDPDPKKKIKNVVVSVSLRRACLQHRMVNTAHMWIVQLIDALALTDYDVLGYTFPQVHTELHFHVIGSAISYIPRNYPYAGLFTLEKFSVSSNVLVNSPMSLLTFLLEDAAFYMSNAKDPSELNVKRDYVQLIGLNYIKLDWKSSDGKNPKFPKTEIECKCTTLHLCTCADSCRALQGFLVYIAEDGDLPKVDPPDVDSLFSPADIQTPPLSQSLTDALMDTDVHGATAEQEVERILPALMMDAMMDSTLSPSEPEKQDKQTFPQDTFLFPDETLENEKNDSDDDSDGDFCVLEKPCMPEDRNPVITPMDTDPINVKDNYFAAVGSKVDLLLPPKNFPDAIARYCLSDLSIIWDIYGGSDFGNKRSKGSSAPVSNRDHTKRIQLCLFKVQLHYELYPDTTHQVARQCLMVDKAEVIDMVQASHMDKMLYRYSSTKCPLQQHTGLLCLKLVTHRPDTSRPERHEADVRVSIQPIRINLDQDTVQFIEDFVNTLNPKTDELAASFQSYNSTKETVSLGPSPPSDAPIMTMSVYSKKQEEAKAAFDEMAEDEEDAAQTGGNAASPALFIRNFVFTPEVLIKLDYDGKHIDVDQSGVFIGLCIGLTSLHNSTLRLKALKWNRGILGVEKLAQFCINEWKKDITRNQLPALIGGVGPLSSLVQFYQGVQDLIWMPIEQYRKDGRVVRGLQRGANSFSSSTSIAVLELSNRLVQTIQGLAEVSYDLLSPDKPASSRRLRHRNNQPRDMREGASDAMQILAEGLGDTANNFYDATADCKGKSLASTVGAVARNIPAAVVAPAMLVPEATSKMLEAMRNQLNPDTYKEMLAKYKAGSH